MLGDRTEPNLIGLVRFDFSIMKETHWKQERHMNREEMNEKYANQGQITNVHSLRSVHVFQTGIVLLFNIITNTTFILVKTQETIQNRQKASHPT